MSFQRRKVHFKRHRGSTVRRVFCIENLDHTRPHRVVTQRCLQISISSDIVTPPEWAEDVCNRPNRGFNVTKKQTRRSLPTSRFGAGSRRKQTQPVPDELTILKTLQTRDEKPPCPCGGHTSPNPPQRRKVRKKKIGPVFLLLLRWRCVSSCCEVVVLTEVFIIAQALNSNF